MSPASDHQRVPGGHDDPLWTTAEVAERLTLERRHVLAAIHDGRLRAYKLGADRLGYRIPESAVQAWLDSSEVNPDPPQ